MSRGLLFWLLMLLWLLLGLYWSWSDLVSGVYGMTGCNLVLFALLALLGWKSFGPAIQSN